MTRNLKAKTYVRNALTCLAVFGSASVAILPAVSLAQTSEPAITTVALSDAVQSGGFEKSNFNISGDWQIVKENNQTIFRISNNFKTKNAPDLKLLLSRKLVGDVTGKTATQEAIKLSVLRSNKGSQDYIIPPHIDLSEYRSILIHCEAFSKLWGGANL